jgi:hypothetical protein
MKRRALKRRYGRAAISEKLGGFASWADVLAAAKAGENLYYRAPLDHRPTQLIPRSHSGQERCYEARARSIRIWPPGSTGRGRWRTADPFTADAGHFNRFSKWVPM